MIYEAAVCTVATSPDLQKGSKKLRLLF